ncbi:apyrase [Anoplophora glabripennis]|uniref:apyrase n=1 Tax=Anoplophora glabripennis TaxID=217634 RepID=UPI0008751B13|nr:apyrase [Anoplophora glabripennis]
MESTSVHMNLLDEEEMVATRDWRKALRAQPAYRIVNRTIRGQTQFICVVGFTGFLLLVILYLFPTRNSGNVMRSSNYNYTYPLTRPIKTNTMHTFRIGIIADLDTNSKSEAEKNTYYSYFKQGYLSYNPKKLKVIISWDAKEPIQLKNNFALKGRGMELSELVTFDGRLLTFEDRTGLVYEIINNQVVPWVLLIDGDGKKAKGFKSEWATVKNEVLYVGSMGKEWTTASGEFQSNDPQYIKAVTPKGEISHINWVNEYKRIREILGIYWPGYMIHESGVWSDKHQRWFFLPRRCSKEPYNESLDEHRGCSVLISANADMYDVQVVQIRNSSPTKGFSSFKFIPTSDDFVIVALRTEELDGNTSSYITAFTIHGDILLEDTYVANVKYEGFEFI